MRQLLNLIAIIPIIALGQSKNFNKDIIGKWKACSDEILDKNHKCDTSFSIFIFKNNHEYEENNVSVNVIGKYKLGRKTISYRTNQHYWWGGHYWIDFPIQWIDENHFFVKKREGPHYYFYENFERIE